MTMPKDTFPVSKDRHWDRKRGTDYHPPKREGLDSRYETSEKARRPGGGPAQHPSRKEG